ncbi:MAG: hypothetical protein SNF33_02100 [Candidatus Algichlamydia australiensis]|nr:hypothetical protein [Chlamydiales bacterium]
MQKVLGGCFEWLGLIERPVSKEESDVYIEAQCDAWDKAEPTANIRINYWKIEEFASPYIGSFITSEIAIFDKNTRNSFNFAEKHRVIYSLAGLSYVNPNEFAQTWKNLIASLEDGGTLVVTFPYDHFQPYDRIRKETTKTWNVKNLMHVRTILKGVGDILYCEYGRPTGRAREVQCVVKRRVPGP